MMDRRLGRERNKLLASIEKFLEGPMIFLGFAWLVLLVIELVWGLTKILEYLSITIWIVFIIDFSIKFILATFKLDFLKKNWIAAVSIIIPAIRVFRLLRILRVVRGLRLIKVVASLNRTMKSLGSAMKRRGFAYVFSLSLVVTFGGAAGMYGIEKGNPGFENYGMALWWTAMRVITAGSDSWPFSPEGRGLAFMLSLFGYAVFGYVTATLATFFIGRDAEEKDAPVAGTKDINELKKMILTLSKKLDDINNKIT